MSEVKFVFNEHLPQASDQVSAILVDRKVFGCIADSLEERRFARIIPTNYKDMKGSIFCSDVIGIAVAYDCCGRK